MRYAWASMAVVLASMAWASAARAADDAPAPSPSYIKDIKPFLAAYCMRCHNERRPRAGVSVATLGDLTRTGKHGALVVPEKPDDSRWIMVMTGKGKPMPPRKAPQPKKEEIAKVRDWIKAGAVDDTPAATDDKTKAAGDSGK